MSAEKELKLKKWRRKYVESQKVEKRKNLLLTLVAITTIAIGSFLIYAWSTDELQFMGRETALVNAIVVDENMIHWGRGYYYQEGTCEFNLNGQRHSSTFKIHDAFYLRSVGDSILIKVAVHKPELSKFIE